MALNEVAEGNGMELKHVSPSDCNDGDTELAEDKAANSGHFKEKSEKIVMVVSLWIAYLLSSVAFSAIYPFFPQIVSQSSIIIGHKVSYLKAGS